MFARKDNWWCREVAYTLGRHFFSILIVLSAAAQVVYGAPASKCSLSGRVTNAHLSGLVVKLKLASESALTTFDGYLAKVAPDGSFRFEGIAPGTYILKAEAPGFLPFEYGATKPGLAGTPITLAAGQRTKNLDLTLVPKTVICGHVTDVSGKPMANARVDAYRKRAGIATLVKTLNSYVETDANGEYRFPDLPTGQYFIQAVFASWFPSVRSFNEAKLIDVGAATTTACTTDIVVDQSGYSGYSVRGEVPASAQPYKGTLFVSVLETNPSGAVSYGPVPGGEPVKPGEKFDLWGVRAGSSKVVLATAYNLVRGEDYPGLWPAVSPEPPNILASQDILVTADVNNISLPLPTFVSLKGHVKLEGITPVEACPSREGGAKVSILGTGYMQYQDVFVDLNRNFVLPYVVPGTYKVQVFPYRRGTVYVKSMLLNGEPVNQDKITLPASSSSELTITLSGDLANADDHLPPNQPPPLYLPPSMYSKASISGTVRNAILPDLAIELWSIRYNSSFSYKYAVRPDKAGRFSFDAVDPGMYVLLARGPGYIPVAYGAKGPFLEGMPITVVSGERRKGINLTAAPGRLVCGKVTREDGQPSANQPIWFIGAPPPVLVSGSSLLWQSPMSDRDGNFRFRVLQPGQYFVGLNTDPSPGHIRIYWRSSWNFADAQPINNPGSRTGDKCEDDIRVPRQVPPGHHVRGRLSGPLTTNPNERFSVGLVAVNSAGMKAFSGGAQVIPINSDFDIPGVLPGSYLIEVYKAFPANQKHNQGAVETTSVAPLLAAPNPPLATKRVTIGNTDIGNLTLDVPPAASLFIKLQFENVDLEERRRWMYSDASDFLTLSDVVNGGVLTAKDSPQDTFDFQDLYHSDFSVRMLLSAPLFVKSVRLDGRLVQGQTFTLLPGQAGKLEIVISDKSAEVDVTTEPARPPTFVNLDEECQLRMPPGARVILIPDPVPEDASGVIGGYEGTDGVRRVEGVPPGKYRAVAFDNYDVSWLWDASDPAIAKRRARLIQLAKLGTSIEVQAGEKLAMTLPDSTIAMQRLRAERGEPMSSSDHCAAGCNEQDFWFRSDLAKSKTTSSPSH